MAGHPDGEEACPALPRSGESPAAAPGRGWRRPRIALRSEGARWTTAPWCTPAASAAVPASAAQTMAEYAVVLVLVTVVILAALGHLAIGIEDTFDAVTGVLP